MPCAVAALAQQLGRRDLIRPRVLADRVAGQDGAGETAAGRQPAGVDGRAGRGARRLRVGRGQAQSAAGERVDVRGRCAQTDTASVHADIAVAEVVDQKDQDVGLASGSLLERREFFLRGLLLGGSRNCWLEVRGDGHDLHECVRHGGFGRGARRSRRGGLGLRARRGAEHAEREHQRRCQAYVS